MPPFSQNHNLNFRWSPDRREVGLCPFPYTHTHTRTSFYRQQVNKSSLVSTAQKGIGISNLSGLFWAGQQFLESFGEKGRERTDMMPSHFPGLLEGREQLLREENAKAVPTLELWTLHYSGTWSTPSPPPWKRSDYLDPDPPCRQE